MKINFRAVAVFCATRRDSRNRFGGAGQESLGQRVNAQAPRFEVDPMWPKPLPNHWVIGNTIGVSVDAKDQSGSSIARVHSKPRKSTRRRIRPRPECCTPAPPVFEFDEAGNLIEHWGGPGEATIGRTRIMASPSTTKAMCGSAAMAAVPRPAGHGSRPRDGARLAAQARFNDNMVLKFTQSGKFLMQIGKPGKSKGSNDVENLKGPAKMFVDPKTNELYVADGYGNHRVIVFDAETGKYKRHWGAYGHKPDDTNLGPYNPDDPPAQQFRNPVHCAELSNDGLLYVCDRSNDRIQVFKPDGTFVKEVIHREKHAAATARSGTSLSPRIRSRSTSIWPTARTRRSTSCCAIRSRF